MKINKSKIIWTGALLSLIWGNQAIAADLLPSASGDATSVGKVSSAELIRPGAVAVGFSFDGADNLHYRSSSSEENKSLSSGHSSILHVGYGFNKYFELDLGIRGTTEILNSQERTSMYGNLDLEENKDLTVKETAYSGAKIQAKVGLVNINNIKFSLAPFIEEGVGQSGKYSLTRSEKMQYGFLGLLSYGHRGVAEANLNLGMRYRDPVILGEKIIRNEGIAKLNIKAYVTDEVSVFVSANGRKLMVGDNVEREEDEKIKYQGKDSGEVLFGASYETKDLRLSAYGGSEMIKEADFSAGERTYGMSVAYLIGGDTGKHSWVKKKKSKAGDWNPKMNKKKKKLGNEYPEMEASINTLADMPDPDGDDFDKLKKRMKKNRKRGLGKSGLSPDEEVERELAELRAAEEKVSKEEIKRENSEATRLDRIRKQKAEQRRKSRIGKKASKVIDDRYSIKASDVSWNGLDD